MLKQFFKDLGFDTYVVVRTNEKRFKFAFVKFKTFEEADLVVKMSDK